MNLTEVTPNLIPRTGKPDAKVLPDFSNSHKSIAKQVDTPHNDSTMLRKSIFADHKGCLISQTRDATGDVVNTYPAKEVIRRYHANSEITG